MSLVPQRILRINRSQTIEGSSSFALVSISAAKGAKNPLDLKLLATEGESAFVTTIKHDKVVELKSKSNPGDSSEWKSILSRTLLHTSIAECGLDAAAIEGLETVFSVPNDETLIITWQRRKRASTQILGSLSLTQTDEEQIDPFIWAGDVVATSDAVEDTVETLQQQLQEERSKTEKLQGQLESLVTAKEEHEQVLFAKFVELLNAKKLKIRDQQRLLAGATIDEDAGHVTSSAGRDEEQTTSKKRSAAGVSSSDDSDDDSDAFEDVSMKANTESPAQSDAASGEEREPTPPPSKPAIRRTIGGAKFKQKASNTKASSSTGKPDAKTTTSTAKSSRKGHKADDREEGGGPSGFDNQPPPKRRELPFQRKPDPLPAPTGQPERKPEQEPEDADEAEPSPPTTRSQAKAADDAMDEDSDTEEEL